MSELPEYWGTAEYEILTISNFTNDKPSEVELHLVGEIRGVFHEHYTTFVCGCKDFNSLAEEITYNCLYVWVESIYNAQEESL